MKIPNFPAPIENETYASTIARYFARTAGSKARHLRNLYLWHSQPNTIAPHHSPNLCALMPNGHPWADNPVHLINNNTLVPMYLFFAPKPRREKTVTDIISKLSRANSMLGLSTYASRVLRPPLNAKHCPICVENDLKSFGFSVAYRQHQPSFVKVCSTHNQILRSNCVNCLPNKPSEFWRMAGICSCELPNTPPVLNECSPVDLDNWLWLARQVDYMVTDKGTQVTDRKLQLNLALRERGFECPNGSLKRSKIHSEIIDTFGYSILEELEAFTEASEDLSKKLRFTKSAKVRTNENIPNTAQMLLLTRVARDSVRDLEERPAPMLAPTEVTSLTYMPRSRLTCFNEREILSTLKENHYKIQRAAKALNVTSSKLRNEINHFQIQIPLSPQIMENIGSHKLKESIKLLKSGYDRVYISKKLDISMYTVRSIELANPGLHSNRHLAKFTRIQKKHRTKYSELLAQNPSKCLNELRKISRTCVAWLEIYDKEWLKQQPRSKGRHGAHIVNLKKLEQQDIVATEQILNTVQAELSKLTRPVKLSKTRLLRSGKINRSYNSEKMLARYPKSFAAADVYAETKHMFYKRLIKWTLIEHKKSEKHISQYSLTRATSINSRDIKQLKTFIQEVAKELDIDIAPGSILN